MKKKLFESQKSQAALEYLATYAWALLVILIMLGAMYYFGVWDFSTPRQCSLIPGLTCSDFEVKSNQVKIVLFNNLGSRITIDEIEVNDCDPLVIPGGQIMEDNSETLFTIESCTITGKKYFGDLNVTYAITESNLPHKVKGEIKSPVTT